MSRILGEVPATLGVAGTKTKWRMATITLSGNQTLTILGDVTIILTAAGIDALSLTGTASIIVPEGAKLTIYIEGNLKLAGNGLANSNTQPASCLIYGASRSPGGQILEIAGNGALKCAIYAPNGDVKINGNGDVMGSIVANKVTLVGNAAFHYDEALAERDGKIEEERRLFYVALTRAKRLLVLTGHEQNARGRMAGKSLFLEELESGSDVPSLHGDDRESR